MKLGLHLIKNPNETFSFVGDVPHVLAYVTKEGNTPSIEEVNSQMLLPAAYRSVKNRVFQSEHEAWIEAARLGYVNKLNERL